MSMKSLRVFLLHSFRRAALFFASCALAGLCLCGNSPAQPDGPPGWTADKPEGSTDEGGGFKLTTVHRDYKKGEADNAPTTSISILDSAANPDYAASTTAAWNFTSSTPEGYTKSVTIEGNPGFETFENEKKHGTLWLMVAKRYFLQIETQGQDAKDLQEWLKRIDLKKLADVK